MYFEKISYENWREYLATEWLYSEESAKRFYYNIKLPCASTPNAAGQDFYAPFEVMVSSNETVVIPTGIRWVTEENDKDKVLMLFPRSGLGTKYGLRLKNTVGIVDADYCYASNEGHIMAVLTSDVDYVIGAGERFMQGVVLPFFRCGDVNSEQRTGGFGSTGEK